MEDQNDRHVSVPQSCNRHSFVDPLFSIDNSMVVECIAHPRGMRGHSVSYPTQAPASSNPFPSRTSIGRTCALIMGLDVNVVVHLTSSAVLKSGSPKSALNLKLNAWLPLAQLFRPAAMFCS